MFKFELYQEHIQLNLRKFGDILKVITLYKLINGKENLEKSGNPDICY
jgi:hypothetical protein